MYWLEIRPSEKGRGVVCSQEPGGPVQDWTPSQFNARSKVHYGAGSKTEFAV